VEVHDIGPSKSFYNEYVELLFAVPTPWAERDRELGKGRILPRSGAPALLVTFPAFFPTQFPSNVPATRLRLMWSSGGSGGGMLNNFVIDGAGLRRQSMGYSKSVQGEITDRHGNRVLIEEFGGAVWLLLRLQGTALKAPSRGTRSLLDWVESALCEL